jgi:hypothetical protein
VDIGGFIGGLWDQVWQTLVGTPLDTLGKVLGVITDGLAHVADFFVGLLPDAGSLGLSAQTGWLRQYTYFNHFLPLPEALAFIAALIGIRVAIFTYRLLDRIWHTIPKPLSGT